MTPKIDWLQCATHPPLGNGELHLWRIRTDARGADPQRCLPLLEPSQQRRAENMRHLAYRERYIRAQAGLRLILGRYLGRPAAEIRFQRGPAGKPALPGDRPEIHFNLTTTGDLALAGFARDAELGIDCERIRAGRDFEGIARKMFDPEQRLALAAAPASDRLEHFYRAWTALEADAKADGRGLFRARAPGAPRPRIAHCVPEDGYIAAVAGQRVSPVRSWTTLDFDPGSG